MCKWNVTIRRTSSSRLRYAFCSKSHDTHVHTKLSTYVHHAVQEYNKTKIYHASQADLEVPSPEVRVQSCVRSACSRWSRNTIIIPRSL
jgi:hypothetical protein